jgi:hypothetical protein
MSLIKIAGPGSVSQRYGSPVPDPFPYQNVTDQGIISSIVLSDIKIAIAGPTISVWIRTDP